MYPVIMVIVLAVFGLIAILLSKKKSRREKALEHSLRAIRTACTREIGSGLVESGSLAYEILDVTNDLEKRELL